MFDLRVNRKPTSVRVDGITILKRPDGTPYNGGDFDGEGLIVNQTFESLAVSRDGLSLFAGMEDPLASDGTDARNRTRKRIIRYVGLPGHEYRPIAQYAYKPDSGLALVELAWVSPTELVSMERTFTAGVGNTIRVWIPAWRSVAALPDVGRQQRRNPDHPLLLPGSAPGVILERG
jgi:hypothetical protein